MQKSEEFSGKAGFTEKDLDQIKKEAFTTCAFCATKLPESQLAEFEITIKETYKERENHGWYICTSCITKEQNRIQDMVVRTWMKIKSRGEKSCCGGGG